MTAPAPRRVKFLDGFEVESRGPEEPWAVFYQGRLVAQPWAWKDVERTVRDRSAARLTRAQVRCLVLDALELRAELRPRREQTRVRNALRYDLELSGWVAGGGRAVSPAGWEWLHANPSRWREELLYALVYREAGDVGAWGRERAAELVAAGKLEVRTVRDGRAFWAFPSTAVKEVQP